MRRLVDLLLFPACVALLCYFGWVYYYGERSVSAHAAIEAEVQAMEEHLQDVREAREAENRRVGLLRSESLDPDMLDEQARLQLNYTKENELVLKNKGLN